MFTGQGGSLLLILLAYVCSAFNNSDCDCFITSGPSPGYFQHYRFWDWRKIPSDGTNDYSLAPPLVSESQINGEAQSVTSGYFNSDEWTNDWTISSYSFPSTSDDPVARVNSRQNLYISKDSNSGLTYLTFRLNRLRGFSAVSEIQTVDGDFLHLSMRASLRIVPLNEAVPLTNGPKYYNQSNIVPGGVGSIFTYYSDSQEIDVEILTRDNQQTIHYTNQPDHGPGGNPKASIADSLPDDAKWTQWLVHRIDWYSDVTRWFVNDELVQDMTLNVPSKPSNLLFNLWNSGGEWSGPMTVGNVLVMGVEWLEVVFNNTDDAGSSGSCNKRCSIDSDGSSPGNPILLSAASLPISQSLPWKLVLSAICTFMLLS